MTMDRQAWSSEAWAAYFRDNMDDVAPISWEAGAQVTSEEREAIMASVQGFQLGESSEGRHLIDRARAWAESHGDPAYVEAVRLFIAEEGRHARDLGRFMDLASIPRIRKALSDTAFRSLRRAAGLELSIAVLVTAEIVAQVYYAALREATGSSVLRALCDRILRDEEAHVRFQSERLALLARGRKRVSLRLRTAAQRGLMFATLFVVWPAHRRAFRAGLYSFHRFAAETWAALERALPLMDPRGYDWPAEAPPSAAAFVGRAT